ncbi:MAG: ABC transporter permease, partial [Rhodanobacteraceae bacterium]
INSNEPPNSMDYTDAAALMRAHRAKFQSAMYQFVQPLLPQHVGQHPLTIFGEAVSSEFFPMLNVPFRYGHGWTAADDRGT